MLLELWANHELSRTVRDYTMAAAVLDNFLGREFVSNRVTTTRIPDPFLLNAAEGTDLKFLHQFRVCQLADALFRLRDVDGPDVLIERLLNRPLRATFFEARAAAHLAAHGLSIEIREETRRRGQDFDFQATYGSTLFHVEVTEATKFQFSPNTLSNKLSKKRSQVPDTHPALLFCTIPSEWHVQADINFWMMQRTFAFFGESARINAVIYQWENRLRSGQGALAALVMFPLAHSKPRLPAPLNFIFGEGPRIAKATATALRGRNRAAKIAEWMESGELENSFSFIQWVKSQPD
jgi:hypothetical protein